MRKYLMILSALILSVAFVTSSSKSPSEVRGSTVREVQRGTHDASPLWAAEASVVAVVRPLGHEWGAEGCVEDYYKWINSSKV